VTYEVIRSGFDKLELSLNVVIPEDLCEHLAAAKEFAQELVKTTPHARSGAFINGVDMSVRPNGGAGGYAYSFETFGLEANWFMRTSTSGLGWNVRVAIRARPLVLNGIGWVKEELEKAARAFGLVIPENGVSIARIDYAVDCLAPGFVFDKDSFVVHSSCNTSRHLDVDEMDVSGKSWKDSSMRVGGITRKQIGIYDKLREVRQKRDCEMPLIWDAARETKGARPLIYEGKNADDIWRVELRAGKDYLKGKWDVTGWGGLFDQLDDIFKDMLTSMRYVAPTSDSNRSRWSNHPLWEIVSKEIAENAMQHVPTVTRERLKEASLRDKVEWLETNILGNIVSHAALSGVAPERFEAHLDELPLRLRHLNRIHGTQLNVRLRKAAQRYEGLL